MRGLGFFLLLMGCSQSPAPYVQVSEGQSIKKMLPSAEAGVVRIKNGSRSSLRLVTNSSQNPHPKKKLIKTLSRTSQNDKPVMEVHTVSDKNAWEKIIVTALEKHHKPKDSPQILAQVDLKRSPPVSDAKKNSSKTVKNATMQDKKNAEKSKLLKTPHQKNKTPPSFSRPVLGALMVGYGPQPDGLHNDGINIQVSEGTAVKASAKGRVIYTGNVIQSYGNMVLLKHEEDWVTAYAHLQNIQVQINQTVDEGQVLGLVGKTGNVLSPQLHFEIRQGSKTVNPLLLLSTA